MSKSSSPVTTFLVWFVTAITSIIGSNAAMSDPLLIDPAQRYQEDDYIVGGGSL